MQKVKKFVPFIVIIIASYWAVVPFFVPGFFPMHDDTQVARVYSLHAALIDGMFPVRWVADLGYGYGYPIFNFYAPLAYYLGSGFMLVGFDALLATKLMMVVGIIFAGVSMYVLTQEFFGKKAGIVAALLYIYAPYHAVQIYVRGDVAELFAYSFIPVVFLGIYKLAISKTKYIPWSWITFTAFAYAGLILSHNLTAFMVTPLFFLFAFLLFLQRKSKSKHQFFSFLGLFLGILLSTFYWLPTIAEMHYTDVLSQIGGTANYADHFVCPEQLWFSQWGFGGTAPGCIDGMSFGLGRLHIAFIVLAIISLVLFWKSIKPVRWIVCLVALGLITSLFLLIQPSRFVWDSVPFMSFFQYPWRFLILVSFFTAILGGFVFWCFEQFVKEYSIQLLAVGGIIFLIIFLNHDNFVPQTMLSKSSSDYTSQEALRWEASKLTDEYLPTGFEVPKKRSEVPTEKIVKNKDIVIHSFTEKTQRITLFVTAKEKSDLVVNQAYFPAWEVIIDEEKRPYRFFDKGIILTIPEGKHEIILQYSETPVEKIANALSVTGILILIVGIISQRRRSRYV